MNKCQFLKYLFLNRVIFAVAAEPSIIARVAESGDYFCTCIVNGWKNESMNVWSIDHILVKLGQSKHN